MEEAQEKIVLTYEAADGRVPFNEWLEALRDKSSQIQDISKAKEYWRDYRSRDDG